MGMFLNSDEAYIKYERLAKSRYFVDKSALIAELIDGMENSQNYFCFTRPRRFGKSIMANMVAAYFGKVKDSSGLFEDLRISEAENYRDHLNRYHVIYIDFSETPEICSDYETYITRILEGLKQDIKKEFPSVIFQEPASIWDMLKETKESFIFILDEWDAVFHMDFIAERDTEKYLAFLKNLLKDKAYVQMAYMTGILPIAKYSDGSELNMFLEYNMAVKKRFGEYFGFSEDEVDVLYQIYLRDEKFPEVSREDLRLWYDGYYNASGQRLYNPRSIVGALSDNQLSNYWVSSGRYDSIFQYVRHNVDAVRDDLVLMVSGERIKSRIQEYAATARVLETKEQIYSAMVIYGLLTYYDGEVFIPNKELMDQYDELLRTREAFGAVYCKVEVLWNSRRKEEKNVN